MKAIVLLTSLALFGAASLRAETPVEIPAKFLAVEEATPAREYWRKMLGAEKKLSKQEATFRVWMEFITQSFQLPVSARTELDAKAAAAKIRIEEGTYSVRELLWLVTRQAGLKVEISPDGRQIEITQPPGGKP